MDRLRGRKERCCKVVISEERRRIAQFNAPGSGGCVGARSDVVAECSGAGYTSSRREDKGSDTAGC